MKTNSKKRSRSGSRDGVALIMTLAFIVLLTILIISYVSFNRLNRISTASYSKSIQAQEIAQGGLQDIYNDLRSEIIAGSMVDPNGSTFTQGTNVIYVPFTNMTAQPARIGYAPASYGTDTSASTLSPSLVRVSRATGNPNAVNGDSFFTQLVASTGYYTNNLAAVQGGTILNRASAASTATSSSNGRSISTARWNKSYLLASTALSVPTPFSNAPPDWVYITRTGSRVCTSAEAASGALGLSNNLTKNYGAVTPGVNPPASPVVGRYAFVMYDEGSLLDASVAGYPSQAVNLVSTPATGNPGGISQAVYGKSYSSYADLTQIPGFAKTGHGASHQAQVDAFVNWRNASAGSGGTLSGANYLNAMFSYAQNGFLQFQTTGTTSDSPLLSRKDLINYFASIDPAFNTASNTYSKALPYLATFTRAVTAPSWSPPLDSPNISPGTGAGYSPPATGGTAPVLYRTNAEKSTSANRDLANVRFPGAFASVTHYDDTGTTITYSVSAGDLLLRHRFSLAKLNWLAGSPETGPSDATKIQAIKDCFGLEWTATNKATGKPSWVYDIHGSGSAPNLTIMTLAQVAAVGREPDFFELLKAGILSGSLGRDPGPIGTSVGPPTYAYTNGPTGVSFDTTAKVPDMQIIQIGANIIDQWDTDSYPTAIYFAGSGYADALAVPEFGPGNMVYGIENLPYINRLFLIGWDTTPSAPAGGTFDCWFEPEFWNPFQTPTVTTNRPISFCLRGYGLLNLTWDESYGNYTAEMIPPGPDPDPPTATFGCASTMDWDSYTTGSNDACVVFSDSAIPSAFANPQVLTAANAGKYSTTLGAPSFGTASINVAPAPPLVSTQGSSAPTASYSATTQFLGIHGGGTPFSWTSVAANGGGNVAWDYAGAWQTQIRTHFAPANQGITFCLMYYDGTQYLPYTYLSRFAAGSPQTAVGSGANPAGIGLSDPPSNKTIGAPATTSDPIWGGYGAGSPVAHVDPLTDRFSANMNDGSHGAGAGPWTARIINTNHTWQDLNSAPFPCEGYGAEYGVPSVTSGFVYWQLGASAWNQTQDKRGLWVGNWAQNNQTVSTGGGANQNYAYYADPDGVVRPGNDYRWPNSGSASTDGMSQLAGAYSTTTGPTASSTWTVSRRPLILNRPFRSVAELGYAYRDLPFKSLDFFSPYSADAALSDAFSLTDEPAIVAGQVNPSNAPLPVIAALVSGSNKQELTSTDLVSATTGEATTLAGVVVNQLSPAARGPLLSRADLVTGLSDVIQPAMSGGDLGSSASPADQSDKSRLEAPIRALAGVANTRTWNLLIDIIAQSGRMSPSATTLDNFVVEGEKRYWLHVAIDRYTGKIVDQQLEPVYE